MKFFMVVIVYVMVGFILALGVLHAINGSWWLLIASLLAYVLAFARIGCLHHE